MVFNRNRSQVFTAKCAANAMLSPRYFSSSRYHEVNKKEVSRILELMTISMMDELPPSLTPSLGHKGRSCMYGYSVKHMAAHKNKNLKILTRR